MRMRAFERVVVIMFENEFRGYVMRNPYMRALAAKGIELSNSFGVMHPSNTNYAASISGEICNISADPRYYTFLPLPEGAPPASPGPEPLTQKTLASTIVEKGLDWRAYLESYSTVDFPPKLAPVTKPSSTDIDIPASIHQTILDYPPYFNMHNPFIRFQNVAGEESQWKRMTSSYHFLRDALDGTLPEYSWFTPGIWSCGHWMWGTYDEPDERAPFLVDQLANWLETFFSVLAFPSPHSRLPKGTMVVITFDESDYNDSYENVRGWDGGYDGPDQIYTILLGDMITPGRIEDEGYNHYSLLKTIEKNFDLKTLGKNDQSSNWFRFLWGESFRWSAPEETPIAKATMVAAASLGDTVYVVYGSGDALSYRRRTKDGWSDEQPVPGTTNVGAIAMASANNTLMLICQSGTALSAMTFSDGTWSTSQQVVSEAQSFSVTSFLDYGDQAEKLMLAWSTSTGLQSQVFASGTWAPPLAVGQQSGGAMVLAVLGASIFLIYQTGGSSVMNVVSYNTAPFNVVTSAGGSNTTQYAWSPSEFPVQHFSAGPKRAPGTDRSLAPYDGAPPFAVATLDGVIHFAHRATDRSILQETTFSLSGILTPQNPVSYKTSASGLSNGYGTLAEAGWSRQTPIPGVTPDDDRALTMTAAGETILLFSQAVRGGPILLSTGSYR
jgi:hypothetical protein